MFKTPLQAPSFFFFFGKTCKLTGGNFGDENSFRSFADYYKVNGAQRKNTGEGD
jgi:hypothetical protein